MYSEKRLEIYNYMHDLLIDGQERATLPICPCHYMTGTDLQSVKCTLTCLNPRLLVDVHWTPRPCLGQSLCQTDSSASSQTTLSSSASLTLTESTETKPQKTDDYHFLYTDLLKAKMDVFVV